MVECRIGVHGLLQIHTQLFPDTLELSQILVVLALVLYLGSDACRKQFV